MIISLTALEHAIQSLSREGSKVVDRVISSNLVEDVGHVMVVRLNTIIMHLSMHLLVNKSIYS